MRQQRERDHRPQIVRSLTHALPVSAVAADEPRYPRCYLLGARTMPLMGSCTPAPRQNMLIEVALPKRPFGFSSETKSSKEGSACSEAINKQKDRDASHLGAGQKIRV